MKTIIFGGLFLLIHIIFPNQPDGSASWQVNEGKTFIVSSAGSDSNSGTVDSPLATLEAARDAARKQGPGPHRIVLMPGEYFLSRPFDLDARDNNLTIEAGSGGMVTIYGGDRVTGWKREGDKFWSVVIPGVKEGTRDFRSFILNGRMPDRARFPETGRLKHQQKWNSSIIPVARYERPPTLQERTEMAYNPGDIPETLNVRNAEVRIYHTYEESLLGVERNDAEKHKLYFVRPATYPLGAWGVMDYVILNTVEGMTRPGQWYLDRTAGKIVYWPTEGEDMTTAGAIVPAMDRIINISGEPDKKVQNITIRGIALQATLTELKPAGFGGVGFNGALSIQNADNCTLDGLEIANTGGLGIAASQVAGLRIVNCNVHHTGACSVKISGGSNCSVEKNHIHHAGLIFPSSAVLFANQLQGAKICNNRLHDGPYSGMIVGKTDLLIEGNLIYRVMLDLQDGAAIYASGVKNSIVRNNVVRDIGGVHQTWGISSYYFDEGASGNILEKNVSINVERPVHNNVVSEIKIRNNVFISEKDMSLSFRYSHRISLDGNTMVAPGRVQIRYPYALINSKDNWVFSEGCDSVPVPVHKSAPVEVQRIGSTPVIDGIFTAGEWPGGFQNLDRLPSRQWSTGAPVMARFSWDDKNLYVGVIMGILDMANLRKGNRWGENDGAEISIKGYYRGRPVTYVIRSFTDGSVLSVTDGGASPSAAERLGNVIKFVSRMKEGTGKGSWMGEWAIPLDALGIKPVPGLKIPFNMCVYLNEYDKWHCFEGTGAENWKVESAGMLQLKQE